jgi:S1-C subfamily serine protease|tara:strand:+ start:1424 stop:2107 length:684 start_codon:yes stop_codon:yes gene_type:complete
MFYYSDDEIHELEVSQISSEYNIGITKAIETSVKIISLNDGFAKGHGSGNLFHIGNHLFVLTATHVIEGSDIIMLQEKNGKSVLGRVVYSNQYTDLAILMPMGQFTDTKSTSYIVSKEHDILAKRLHYYGYPKNLEGMLLTGFVSQSNYKKILMQSYGWFGASGSVVFDNAGRTVGVVHAISTQISPMDGMPVLSESIVVVCRAYDLSRKTIRESLVNAKAKSRNSD